MKNLIILLPFLALPLSCKKDEHLNCQDVREIAKSDFKKGKYIYYEYQFLTDDKSSNEEYRKILKDYNIKVIFNTSYPISDIVDKKNQIEENKACYEEMMNILIKGKFGYNYFDIIRKKADSIYSLKSKK